MSGTSEVYEFGLFALDVVERRLSSSGRVVPLAPRAYEVLVALVRRAGTLVTKRELLDLVWRDVSVEEGVLSVYVSSLRKSLGDSGEGPEVHRDGAASRLPLLGRRQAPGNRCRTAVDEVAHRRAPGKARGL